MAIVIPSSKTYDRQNPKVRDNVIERIEVGAVEVVPDNEYETPVYNENIKSPNFNEEKKHNLKYEKYTYLEEDSAVEYEDYIGIYAGITAKYTNIDISVPKLSNNKLISNLVLKKDDESIIGINLICEVRYYSVTADYDTATNTISNIQRTENEQKRETKHSVNIQEIFSKQNGEKGYLYFSKSENKYGVYGGTVSIETNIKDNNNILSTSYNDENKSYEIKGLKILSGATGLGLSGHSGDYDYIPLTGDEVDYTPIQVELTVYGNTIGINLIDKTVYIPETDKTSKKVFSVEGNELMQTSNYVVTGSNIEKLLVGGGKDYTSYLLSANHDEQPPYTRAIIHLKAQELIGTPIIVKFYEVDQYYGDIINTWQIEYTTNDGTIDTGTQYYFSYIEVFSKITTQSVPAIEKLYAETQAQYASGKETATIRCSISDYFEIDGTKAIAIDNSTGKMSFKLYDQVIPMVYGADGQDRPMSTYKDGSAKVFQVLGSKIFYDGAVWQELSLQEVDKTKIL